MDHLRRLALVALLLAPVVSLAGDIQVLCPPGLRVYLNDEYVGMSTSRDDGLFIMNVPNGAHTVRVEKDGFAAQEFQVEFRIPPIEVEVGDFTPVATEPVGSEATPVEVRPALGMLVITSAPQNCTVEIDGRVEEKATPTLTIGGLTPGEHRVVFRKTGYEPISRDVTVEPGGETSIRGNLKEVQVETVHIGKGSLRVISTPMTCEVWFMGRTRDKIYQRLNLSYIPAGEYPISFLWRGKKLSTSIEIRNEQRTIVEVSFMKGDEPIAVSYEPL